MTNRRLGLLGVSCLVPVVCLGPAAAPAQQPDGPRKPAQRSGLGFNLDVLPQPVRESVRKVVQQPTLATKPAAEEFRASPVTYAWMLENPDRVSRAWRKLGVNCLEVTRVGPNGFTCGDGQGNEVRWETVWSGPEGRLWYATGQTKPGPRLPVVPVKAVALLRHTRRDETDAASLIRHSVDVYVQADSRAANVLTRLLGPAGPRLAEQGAEQLLQFFSTMARYLLEHPDQIESLLGDAGK